MADHRRVKYYLYISDTKVDMLFAQISRNILKKISADLNINLGVVSVSLKEKQSEQTRFDKVNVVSNYINNHLEVGSIDSPQSYFKGTMPMKWGPIFDTGPYHDLVYFAGKTERTSLGLAGSMWHVIGSPKGSGSWGLPSGGHFILKALREFSSDIGISTDNTDPIPDSYYTDPEHKGDLYDIDIARQLVRGPEERLEFLARRLVEGTLDYKTTDFPLAPHVLLGSPIYVAYTD
jgi:hypothetical protein